MVGPGHERLEQLFSDALEKESWERRSAYLDEECGDDSDLRTHVEQLLKAHDRAGSFLDAAPVDHDATIEVRSPSETAGTRVGRYKILQEIGEGGFGSVYMAQQEEPVRREVALKIIKLGMDTKQVIARFEAERQALALMDHPNIARVFDAGATETGRPYFVMELVKGVTVTEYCDKSKLSIRDRLAIFLPVCHAVQHAHQKGIIHRDLKPSNVLVTLGDNGPAPKVIDFGIAKATTQRLTDKTLYTEFRQFIGTPEYMSPDQAEVSRLDVDTRTDIYSLGVLLYELLTGTTPFDAKSLRESSYEEIRRTIREVEPPKPSTRLQTLDLDGAGKQLAILRGVDRATLSRQIRGELDWIVMKAMEKDRTRRYATAKDLADDIERCIAHEPIEAGPPGVAYKVRKFVRRHRVGVLASSTIVAALLVGLSLAISGLIQAKRARVREGLQLARAEASAVEESKQADKSKAIYEFLQEMLRSVDPSKALGREVTVRYALDEAAEKIEQGALSEQPEVEAAVRQTLGETYVTLGLYGDAEKHLRKAQALRTRLLGTEHPDTLRSSSVLGGLLCSHKKFAEAEPLLRTTADAQRRVLGFKHRDTLATNNELALALCGLGRFSEAEPIHRRTMEIQLREFGEEDPDTLATIGRLGAVCRALGNFKEAETLLRRALDLSVRVLGEDHPNTTSAMNNLGMFFEDQRDYVRAGELYRRTHETDRRILGADHPHTVLALNNLLRILQIQGAETEARPLIVDRLEHLKRSAQRSDASALTLYAYGWELLNCDLPELLNPAAALPVLELAVEKDGGRDANILDSLALAYKMTGNLDHAIATQRRAVDRAMLGGPYDREEMRNTLFNYRIENKDLVAAAGMGWDGLASQFGASLFPVALPGASFVSQSEELMEQGRYAEAAAALRGCLAIRQKEWSEGHWSIADVSSRLGAAVAGDGKYDEAEQLLLDAYASLRDDPQAPARNEREALERIVHLYEEWGKPDLAAEWRQSLDAVPADALDAG